MPKKRKSKAVARQPDLTTYPVAQTIIDRARALGLRVTFTDAHLPPLYNITHRTQSILVAGHRLGMNTRTFVARDKVLTKRVLQHGGIRVPRGIAVSSASEGLRVASTLRMPLVVKPTDRSLARGVTTGITTRRALATALDAAFAWGKHVLIEEFAPGAEYRVTILDGVVIGALRYDPPSVQGDGRSTVRTLIASLERQRGQGNPLATHRALLRTDGMVERTLRAQRLTLASIPRRGTRVLLRPEALLSRGGLAIDVTETLHPRTHALARAVATALNMRFVGIDILGPAERATGALAVIEVNSSPDPSIHLAPDVGTSRDIITALLIATFPSVARR